MIPLSPSVIPARPAVFAANADWLWKLCQQRPEVTAPRGERAERNKKKSFFFLLRAAKLLHHFLFCICKNSAQTDSPALMMMVIKGILWSFEHLWIELWLKFGRKSGHNLPKIRSRLSTLSSFPSLFSWSFIALIGSFQSLTHFAYLS